MGRAGYTGNEEPIGNAGAQKPTIEPVRKFFEIELPPGASAPVIRPVNKGLRITDHHIDPVKDLVRGEIGAQRDLMVGFMRLRGARIDGCPIALPDPEIFNPPPQHLLDRRLAQVGHGL